MFFHIVDCMLVCSVSGNNKAQSRRGQFANGRDLRWSSFYACDLVIDRHCDCCRGCEVLQSRRQQWMSRRRTRRGGKRDGACAPKAKGWASMGCSFSALVLDTLESSWTGKDMSVGWEG